MLLGDALLGDAVELDLLALVELGDETAVALGVGDDGDSDSLVGAVGVDNQVAGIDVHVLLAGALDVESELDATVLAVLLAVAVAGVQDGLEVGRVERDQTEAVGNHLVGHGAGILLDLDEIDSESRNLGHHDAAERVDHVKLDVVRLEADEIVIGLSQARQFRPNITASSSSASHAHALGNGTYLVDLDRRAQGLVVIHHHGIVIHVCEGVDVGSSFGIVVAGNGRGVEGKVRRAAGRLARSGGIVEVGEERESQMESRRERNVE